MLVFAISQSANGQLYLPSGRGVDSRLLCFVLLLAYTVVQAHSRPYLLPSDNALEVCILIALMFMMFADIALDRVFCTQCLGLSELKLKTIVVAFTVILVLFLVAMHKKLNAKVGALAKVGLVNPDLAAPGSESLTTTISTELAGTMVSDQQAENGDELEMDANEQIDMAAMCEEFGLEMHVLKMYKKAFKVRLSLCFLPLPSPIFSRVCLLVSLPLMTNPHGC